MALYAGIKDRSLLPLPLFLGNRYPDDWTVYRGEDLHGDVDALGQQNALIRASIPHPEDGIPSEEVLGVSFEEFGIEDLDAVDLGLYDEPEDEASYGVVLLSALAVAGAVILAGPQARVRRNARQIERRVENYCELIRKDKGDVRQKVVLGLIQRDIAQYEEALSDLKKRLERRREKDKATILLASNVASAENEIKKLKKMVDKADQNICSAKSKGSSNRKGARMDRYEFGADEQDVLMDVLGMSQDDLDFLEAFGEDPPAAPPPPQKPFPKARTFFKEQLPEMIEKVRSQAERSKMRAARLERRAAEASRRAGQYAVKADEQRDTAARLYQIEQQPLQAPVTPGVEGRTQISTTTMVGIGAVLVLAAGAVGWYASRLSRFD